MANIKGCFSHNSDHWATPSKLYNAFKINGYLDPCPLHCGVDNLHNEYSNCGLFINPPFSELDKWIDFAINCAERGCIVWLLMPSRTDTKYFQRLCRYNVFIWFFIGRLHFNDSEKPAPFPAMCVFLQHDYPMCHFEFGSMELFIQRFLDGDRCYSIERFL